jgi:hypothetical protein
MDLVQEKILGNKEKEDEASNKQRIIFYLRVTRAC